MKKKKEKKLVYNEPGIGAQSLPEVKAKIEHVQRASATKERARSLPTLRELQEYKSANGASPPHPLNLFKRLQDENPWVDLSVRVVGQGAAACVPLFRITSKKKGHRQAIEYLEDLLEFPNNNTDGYSLIKETVEDLVWAGNAYWQIIKDRKGALHSLHRLAPETIRIMPYVDEQENVIKFRYYQFDPFPRIYEHDEIIHFKNTNKRSAIYGRPVFYANMTNITTDENISQWVSNFFDQSFGGGVIFKMEADADTADRNREWLSENYGGPEAAGLPLLLEGDINLVSDGSKLKDFDFEGLKSGTKEEILNHAGVPVSMAGVRSGNGNANAEVLEQEESVFLRTIEDYQKMICATINRKLFRELLEMREMRIRPGLNLGFNLNKRIRTVEAASKIGVRFGDAYELLGLPPIESEEGAKLVIVTSNNGNLRADAVYFMDPTTGEEVDPKIIELMNGTPGNNVKPPSNLTNPSGR